MSHCTGPATKRLHQRDHRPTEEHFVNCAVRVALDLQLAHQGTKPRFDWLELRLDATLAFFRFNSILAAKPDTHILQKERPVDSNTVSLFTHINLWQNQTLS